MSVHFHLTVRAVLGWLAVNEDVAEVVLNDKAWFYVTEDENGVLRADDVDATVSIKGCFGISDDVVHISHQCHLVTHLRHGGLAVQRFCRQGRQHQQKAN